MSEDKEECRCPCSTCCYVEPGDGDQWRVVTSDDVSTGRRAPHCAVQLQTAPTDNAPPLSTVLASRLQCCRLHPPIGHSTALHQSEVCKFCCYQWAPLYSWLIGGCFLITCTIYKCTDYSASHKIYKHEAWSMWGKHEDNLFWSVSVIPIMYVNK